MPINVNADQLLALLIASGSPSVAIDQTVALLLEQRLVPQTIYNRVDQMLALIVERRGLHIVLTASATTALGNGAVQVTITGTVRNPAGYLEAGIALSLGQTGFSTISAPSGVSNAQGQVFWTVTDTNIETVTYTVTNLPSSSVSVQFTASRADGTVYSQRGQSLAGAQIYAVHQPANLSSVPPSILLNVFSDPLAQNPITQPIITSGLGNYAFYYGSTLFTLVVSNGGTTQVYADQEVGKPSVAFHNFEWWVKSAGGPSIPGAQIFILDNNFPNIPTILGKGKPAPLQQVFSDPNGITSLVQPLITDSYGYTDCYAPAGVYIVAVYLGGRLQVTYPDQSVGGIYAGVMGRYDLWARTALGIAVPNARVLVSTQPCVIPQKLVPEFPSSLAFICSDPNGLVPVTQSLTYNANGTPIISSLTADADGHIAFYAAPNVPYTVSVYGSQNVLMYSLPDQVI